MLGIQFGKKDVTVTLNVRSHTAPRQAKANSESRAGSQRHANMEDRAGQVTVRPARNSSQASKTLAAAANVIQREEHARLKRSHLEVVIATIAWCLNGQSPG